MERPRTGAQLLLEALSQQNVDIVFGYPGGAIMPVYDALVGSPIRHILTRHEQGAGLAALGYARAAPNRVGVCFATSGPGATNLVTAIADAYLDSVPLVAITGQVAQPLMGTDAFQEVDIFGVTLPIVKHSFIVRRAHEIPAIVARAFAIARSGRPGPVLVDLPKDLAAQVLQDAPVPLQPRTAVPVEPDPMAMQAARELLRTAQRPVLYLGGGILAAGAVDSLRHMQECAQIPAVCTLKGLGALPTAHPWLLGMLGMHGNQAANLAVQECDLLICVGARFDDRATGHLSTFAPGARVIHLDADAAEVGKLRAADVAIVGGLRQALPALALPLHIEAWRQACTARRQQYAWRYATPGDGDSDAVCGIAPAFIAQLTAACDPTTVFTTDVGQHQMWVAQHAVLHAPQQLHTSGGLGTMGFGLPAAIGAQIAQPQARVINFTGDGSFMMNVQELATIKRFGLPIRIVLFDNQTLGMVRQWQELFFEERYSETDLSDNPDFALLAQAFGIPTLTVDSPTDVPAAHAAILSQPGPLLVHVRIRRGANVWPLVPPGRSNAEMLDGQPA